MYVQLYSIEKNTREKQWNCLSWWYVQDKVTSCALENDTSITRTQSKCFFVLFCGFLLVWFIKPRDWLLFRKTASPLHRIVFCGTCEGHTSSVSSSLLQTERSLCCRRYVSILGTSLVKMNSEFEWIDLQALLVVLDQINSGGHLFEPSLNLTE